MVDVPARSAARRLASELKLPSWKGAVAVMRRGETDVLVVAADKKWIAQRTIPARYCGYRVETDEPFCAVAQA